MENQNKLKNVSMYCVKCREHVIVIDLEKVLLKTNRPAIKGHCPNCQTMTFKIVSNTIG